MIVAEWLDAAGALYFAGVRAEVPLDRVVASFLKGHKDLGDEGRAFVVDVAQGMLRARRRLEAAAETLDFEATRGALAALYLVGARRIEVHTLPIDRAGGAALRKAWHSTDAAPLAVRAAIPDWLADTMVRERPDAEALCLSFAGAPPTTLRANTLKAPRDAVANTLRDEGLASAPTRLSPDGLTLEKRANVFRTAAFHDGLFEVQDEGSQLIGLMCEAKPGMVVVDGCAGAGGKTLHLAALMEGKGTLHAFDTATHRLEALRERARRAGAHNVRVHDLADTRPRKRLKGTADVVLVDAPCSGTGVLRRNPDTSWHLVPDDVDRLCVTQAEILDAYAPLVKPGGRLVYATCSLLERENGDTVRAFLARTPGFSLVDARGILERQGVHLEARDAGIGEHLRVDPVGSGTDGFYACALVRAAADAAG